MPNISTPPPGDADQAAAHVHRMALPLADRRAIAEIQQHACRVTEGSSTLWDLRPMLDTREHSPEFIDEAAEVIDYAHARGLIQYVHGSLRVVRVLRTA